MSEIQVRYEHGDHFHVQIREHGLVVDQPRAAGGDDLGPTPTELFVASLAACVGFYAERFMHRHGLATDGLALECDFAMSEDRPARVSDIEIRIALPEGFPEARRLALMRVVEHCTVHNSITQAPEIRIDAAVREKRLSGSSSSRARRALP